MRELEIFLGYFVGKELIWRSKVLNKDDILLRCIINGRNWAISDILSDIGHPGQ